MSVEVIYLQNPTPHVMISLPPVLAVVVWEPLYDEGTPGLVTTAYYTAVDNVLACHALSLYAMQVQALV